MRGIPERFRWAREVRASERHRATMKELMRVLKKKTVEERLGDSDASLRRSSALPERERDLRVLGAAVTG